MISKRCLRLFRLSAAAMCLVVAVVSPARTEPFQYPVDVVAAPDGAVYVADLHVPGVWKVTPDGVAKFFQGQKKLRTPLNAVRCLAIDGQGRLLAGDSATREIYRWDDDDPDAPTPLTGGKIGMPLGLAVRADGEILVSDQELHCIWKVPADGGAPIKLAPLTAPVGVCLDRSERLWVVSRRVPQLVRLDRDGKQTDIVKQRVFQFPHHVAVDESNTAFVSDGYGACIWRVGPDGKPEKLVEGQPLVNPVGLTLQGKRLLVSDSRARRVFAVTANGQLTPFAPK